MRETRRRDEEERVGRRETRGKDEGERGEEDVSASNELLQTAYRNSVQFIGFNYMVLWCKRDETYSNFRKHSTRAFLLLMENSISFDFRKNEAYVYLF